MSGIQLIEIKKLSEKEQQQQPYYNSSFITDDYKNPSVMRDDYKNPSVMRDDYKNPSVMRDDYKNPSVMRDDYKNPSVMRDDYKNPSVMRDDYKNPSVMRDDYKNPSVMRDDYKNPSVMRDDYKNPSVMRDDYKNPSVMRDDYKNPSVMRDDYKNPSVMRDDYKNPSVMRDDYKNPSVMRDDYKNPSVMRDDYKNPSVMRDDYKNPSVMRDDYKNPSVMRDDYKNPSVMRDDYKNPSVMRDDYKNPSVMRDDYKNPSVMRDDYKNPSVMRDDYKNPSVMRDDYKNPSVMRDDYKNPSVMRDDYKNPSVMRDDYKNPSVMRDDYKNPSVMRDDYKNPSVMRDDYKNPSFMTDDYKNPSVMRDDYKNPSVMRDDYKNPSVMRDDYKNPSFMTDDNQKVEYNNAHYEMVDTLQTNEQVILDPEVQMENGQVSEKEEDLNRCQKGVLRLQTGCYDFLKAKKSTSKYIILILLAAAYFAYFGYAMYYRLGDEGSHRLLGFTVFAVVLINGKFFFKRYDKKLNTFSESVESAMRSKRLMKARAFTRWFLKVGVFIFLVVYIVLDVAIENPRNLISVAGLALYIIIFYFTSTNPAKVHWHTVFWGIAMQYIFALVILRTQWGSDIFKWLGDRVTELLEYTMAGVKFVFGDLWFQHFFAFKVLSIVVFFATYINIMYFLGVMQFVIRHLGRFLSFCMDTTPAESISAAGNIFLGMIEAPLMIRPFLADMTKSELHAVMTGGFASIAGSVLGAYIGFGVPANHLLAASVMSAPAALAISKLAYPETEPIKASSSDYSRIEKSEERNLIEAASAGATASIKLLGAIAVNVIAFLSLLDFVNSTLIWFGDRVGLQNFSFQFICSYVLYPVAYFMGSAPEDSRKVAEMIGVKTFTNEFIAYAVLSDLISNRHKLENYTTFFNGTGLWSWRGDNILLEITNQTLKGGVISVKSEVIATYALCGFSNFGSIGITLGGMTTLAPNRKKELSRMVLRSMIAGNVACFLTACIASLLYKEI